MSSRKAKVIAEISPERVDLTLGDGVSLPAIGDVVEIDHYFTGPNGEAMVIALCLNLHGTVTWVADLMESEIEMLSEESMGMHFGLIAAKTSVSELRAAFSETWPALEVTASKEGFSNADEVWTWRNAHERFVSVEEWLEDNQGSEAYVLCQDGPWAVIMDFRLVIAGDEAALQKLSDRFGVVLSFIVESVGGSAHFCKYEAGQLRRMIQNVDGKVTSSGDSLPQEAGIDVERYYTRETEQLMRAFGLSAPDDLPIASTAIAFAAVDRTNYAALALTEKLSTDVSAPERPRSWWMFWSS